MKKSDLLVIALGFTMCAGAALLGAGCATMHYSNTTPDGSKEEYTIRESTLPGMKLESRKGDVHTEINADGSSLFEMGREEKGLDTTGQLQMIVGLAKMIAGGGMGASPVAQNSLSPQPALPPASSPVIEELVRVQVEMQGTIHSLRAIVRTYRVYGRRGRGKPN